MKYSININQLGVDRAGLLDKVDLADMAIFDAFRDFANSNRCKKFMEGGRVWFWIDYKLVIDELPLCRIKTRDGMYRRMVNLAQAQIIEFYPGNQKLGKSFFAWGVNYDALIIAQPPDEKPEGYGRKTGGPPDEKPEGYGRKTGGPPDEKPDDYSTTYQVTNPLTTNPLTTPATTAGTETVEAEYFDEKKIIPPTAPEMIVWHLNRRTGQNFKPTTKATAEAVNARLKEGFEVADFLLAIDFKTAEWLGHPKWQPYLNPTTLFRPGNFEKYVNAARLWQQAGKPEISKKNADNGTNNGANNANGGNGQPVYSLADNPFFAGA